jgi:Domain of unknown function (DUF4406)
MSIPRLYLSGPMSAILEFNIPAFRTASEKLRRAGFTVTTPHEVVLPCGCAGAATCGPDPHEWSEWVRADLLQMLQTADALATLPGVESSRGARLEISVAESLGWQVQPVGFWLGEAALSSLAPGDLLRARA